MERLTVQDLKSLAIGHGKEAPKEQLTSLKQTINRLQYEGFGKWRTHKCAQCCDIMRVSLPLTEEQKEAIYTTINNTLRTVSSDTLSFSFDHTTEDLGVSFKGAAVITWNMPMDFESAFDNTPVVSPFSYWKFTGTAYVFDDAGVGITSENVELEWIS